MVTTVLLIRHGRTAWIGRALAGHTPGVALDEVGAEQARRTADRIKHLPIEAIYSSPLQRTLETAQPLADVLRLPVQQSRAFIEVDFGQWTGRSMEQLEADPLWKRFNTLRSVTRAPGGDLMLEVQARMVDELEALRRRHPGGTVAVFSHQDAIKAALAHYLGSPLDLFLRFEIAPASVSTVALAEWGPTVLTMNRTGEF